MSKIVLEIDLLMNDCFFKLLEGMDTDYCTVVINNQLIYFFLPWYGVDLEGGIYRGSCKIFLHAEHEIYCWGMSGVGVSSRIQIWLLSVGELQWFPIQFL